MDILGAAHIHSRTSYDGALGLTELRAILLARDMRFALMAEHTDHLTPRAAEDCIRACREASDDQFVFVPGFEVPYLGTHILALGTDAYHHGGPADELLRSWRAGGALLVLAHPHRNGYRTDDFLRSNLDGIEMWNSQYDGIRAPRSRAWAMVRTWGVPIRAYGSLDLHRAAHVNGPRLAIQVPALREADIMARLRQGAFSIRRGNVVVASDGTLVSGSSALVRALGVVMPILMAVARRGSSLLARIGIRSFPLKRWLRARL